MIFPSGLWMNGEALLVLLQKNWSLCHQTGL